MTKVSYVESRRLMLTNGTCFRIKGDVSWKHDQLSDDQRSLRISTTFFYLANTGHWHGSSLLEFTTIHVYYGVWSSVLVES